jgi:hypothetical protein
VRLSVKAVTWSERLTVAILNPTLLFKKIAIDYSSSFFVVTGFGAAGI